MRPRTGLIALGAVASVAVLLAAGCGGGTQTGATPETVIGSVPTQTTSTAGLPALSLKGDAAAGKSIFASQGCGGCHTLAAAGAAGTVGPNLDQVKPTFDLAVTRITKGRGAMPAFGDRLKPQQIADVAQYIVSSTGG